MHDDITLEKTEQLRELIKEIYAERINEIEKTKQGIVWFGFNVGTVGISLRIESAVLNNEMEE